MARDLRVASRKRDLFEPHLKEKLSIYRHRLDEFFDFQRCPTIISKAGEKTSSTEILVYCNDVLGLINRVKEARNLNDPHLKFGIDGGGGFLKVCLSVQTPDPVVRDLRQKYVEGVAAKKFKDSGVKKLFILAVVAGTQENYENVHHLWSLLHINNFPGTIATDLKLANILVGIMSHSSSFPCTWCFAGKENLDTCGEKRTMDNCRKNYVEWEKINFKKSLAKKYRNCSNAPVLSRGTNDTRQILDIIAPPELHLMLGVVNTLYNRMKEEYDVECQKWAKRCNATQDFVHGAPAFAGNSCKLLLEKIEILREICRPECLNYVKCFQDFREVVESCFSNDLKSNYLQAIEMFKKSYLDFRM